MSLNGFKDLSCRLCLSKEKLQVSIFSEYGIENNIAKKISICLPVDVTVVEKDEFSKTICNKCLCKLNMNYNFFLQTLKTSRSFKNKDKESPLEEEKQLSEIPNKPTFDSINEFPKQLIVNSPPQIELNKTTQMDSSSFQVNPTIETDDFEIPVPPTDEIKEQQLLDDILETESVIGLPKSPVKYPIVKSQQLEREKFGKQIIVRSQTNNDSLCQIDETFGNNSLASSTEIPSSQVSTSKCKSHHKHCLRRKRHSKNCSKNKKHLMEPTSDRENFKMDVDISPDLFSSSNSDFFGFD